MEKEIELGANSASVGTPRAIIIAPEVVTVVATAVASTAGPAAVSSDSSCCISCGGAEPCCTCLKSLCWIAMICYLLEWILSIPSIWSQWSHLFFRDNNGNFDIEFHAFVMLWGLHRCVVGDYDDSEKWHCESDHWHRIEKGNSDVAIKKIKRPSPQHFAAAMTTLGIIFGILGFAFAIVATCVPSTKRHCIVMTMAISSGCLIVGILQMSAAGAWSTAIEDDWSYTKLVIDDYDEVEVESCSSGCGLMASAGCFGTLASFLLMGYCSVVLYHT